MIPYFSMGYHRPPFTPPGRRFGLTGSGRSACPSDSVGSVCDTACPERSRRETRRLIERRRRRINIQYPTRNVQFPSNGKRRRPRRRRCFGVPGRYVLGPGRCRSLGYWTFLVGYWILIRRRRVSVSKSEPPDTRQRQMRLPCLPASFRWPWRMAICYALVRSGSFVCQSVPDEA